MIEFEIKKLPPMLNVLLRKHYMERKKIVDEWNQIVWALTANQRPKEPFKYYKLNLIRYSSTEPDFDGCVGSFKIVVDALRYAKILADDKISNSGSWSVKWVKSAKAGGKIWVRIEDTTKIFPSFPIED